MDKIAPEMQETMQRLIKIEILAEELESLRVENLQFNEKKEKNRECLGAFRRGEIQNNSKLWYTMGGDGNMMVKLPRKNAVQMIESEQVKLAKLIEETRNKIKQKSRQLLELQPNLTDMDPFTVGLLLREQKKKSKNSIEEEGSDAESD